MAISRRRHLSSTGIFRSPKTGGEKDNGSQSRNRRVEQWKVLQTTPASEVALNVTIPETPASEVALDITILKRPELECYLIPVEYRGHSLQNRLSQKRCPVTPPNAPQHLLDDLGRRAFGLNGPVNGSPEPWHV